MSKINKIINKKTEIKVKIAKTSQEYILIPALSKKFWNLKIYFHGIFSLYILDILLNKLINFINNIENKILFKF